MSLDHIVFVEPDSPRVVYWTRNAEQSWQRQMIEDIGGSLHLPDLGVALALREIYDGVAFPARPRLVEGGGADEG